MSQLSNKKVAILATHGFEESELISPKEALEQAGATTHVISMEAGTIKAWKDKNWGQEVKVDVLLADAKQDDYDALVLPGGVMNPDKLRMEPAAVAFAAAFIEQGKPVAAICHGPQTLIETGMLKGREVTSFPSLKTDLENAGAIWTDAEVVTDRGLVTSRTPNDLPAFNRKMIEEIGEGIHTDEDV
ncbi:MAG: type 1 glutamine amidotransferase [Sphingobacteriales bacterium]|nr:MAG: type 1 glutamine amidotransferase [Sphingobacteriales bacterium]